MGRVPGFSISADLCLVMVGWAWAGAGGSLIPPPPPDPAEVPDVGGMGLVAVVLVDTERLSVAKGSPFSRQSCRRSRKRFFLDLAPENETS